jgi:GntR family transcriptional repressor for pyruvate dehydrogenase complex
MTLTFTQSVRPVDRRRLYQQIADDIEHAILDGTLAPGTRLPGEHELAEQYGVSRNVIRETLKRLKEHGLIHIRTGSGAFVSIPTAQPVTDALQRLIRHSASDVAVFHLYEVRRFLEPQAALLAAQRGTPEAHAAVEAALAAMRAHRDDPAAWTAADLEFHLAVASASGNPLMRSILNPLTDSLRTAIQAGYVDRRNVAAGLEAHTRILDAILLGDGPAAHQAMLDHLLDSEARLAKLAQPAG